MSQTIRKKNWWLSYAGFPDFIWSRIQIYDYNTAEILTMDGDRDQFKNEEDAILELQQDE